MIKKLWVKFKFNSMDVECVCNENNRKCRDKQCKEYVVKFTEIKREKEFPKLDKEAQDLNRVVKKLKKSETELVKSMRKFRKFKIR